LQSRNCKELIMFILLIQRIEWAELFSILEILRK
jgi:hypothetical protein